MLCPCLPSKTAACLGCKALARRHRQTKTSTRDTVTKPGQLQLHILYCNTVIVLRSQQGVEGKKVCSRTLQHPVLSYDMPQGFQSHSFIYSLYSCLKTACFHGLLLDLLAKIRFPLSWLSLHESTRSLRLYLPFVCQRALYLYAVHWSGEL